MKVDAVSHANSSLEWAQQNFPEDVLAVGTCRWWTCGEEERSEFQAPYAVINAALREEMVTDQLMACIDAIVLLMWALEHLPPSAKSERKTLTTVRYTAWLFPGFSNYDLEAHFPAGAEMTRYDFNAASQNAAILNDTNFRKKRWVYQDDSHFPLVRDLVEGKAEANEEVVRALDQAEDGVRLGEVPGTSFSVVRQGGGLCLIHQERRTER